MFEKIKKRDERIVKFDQRKITDAILKAGQETKEFGLNTSRKLSNKVVKKAKEIIKDKIPTVEKIQDIVETVLIESGYIKTAKAYIIYRDQHAKIRDVKRAVSLKLVDEYIENEDWRVNENSNMTYSLQGLNNHIASVISAHYWLYKIYPKDVRKAHICGDFHIHDLSIIAPYCISSMQRVITCNGSKLAKDVRIGDELMGFDSIEFKPTKVIEIFEREVDEILEIRAKAGKVIKKIKVTCEHPFLTKEGWIEAGDLKKGDIIITATGKDMKAFYHNYGRLKNKEDLWNMKSAREVLYERMKNKEFRENLDEIGRRNLKKAKEVYKELWKDEEWKKWIIDRRRKSGLYKKASQRMKFNNPMKDKETAKRVATNRKRNNTGFFETNNPMNDPVKKREIMKKAGSRRLPSGLEKRILKIIKKHNLPINYVGNGDIWIGKYNPDFIDETGEKLIEVFRSSMFGTSRIPEMEKKKRHYKKYNKKCLLLNADNYSNDIEIAKEIREFISNGAEIIDIKKIRAKRFRGRQYKYKVINFHCEPFNNFVVERMITHNCVGWDLKDLLIRGFGGVPGKIESKPAKHFRAALGQIVNFFYTLQGETAGAEAFSSIDTYLAPFIKYDKLSYKETKQAIQEFLFNINIPTRVGFQTPFTNVTMDLVPPKIIADEHVIIGGKMRESQYGEFQKEIDLFNKAFAEVMSEGDAKGRVFTFPIPTYNITEDFNWDNPTLEPIWTMTSKYGTPYFANFIHSDMKPEDATSMCCRLRIDQRELRKRGGGFFAANPLTGSIGVATINMPRIGYFSKDEKEFFDRLKEKMDLAKKSLEIKRKVLERFTENNLYPYAKYYLNSIKKRFRGYWRNHFSTIGLIGMNEACLNFLGKDIATQEGRDFSIRVLDFMREKLMDYQNETNNIYNLEATPAEGATFRLAKTDKEKFPEILCANEEAFKNGTAPYYTNSTQLPVEYTDDIFEALDLQDELQTKYTGGTVFHSFVGEKLPDGESSKILVKKIAENYRLPYFTITPTFSICPQDGYLSGEHETCPECGAITEVYSRVVGYIRPVKQWNKGKRSEFKDRKTFLIDKK